MKNVKYEWVAVLLVTMLIHKTDAAKILLVPVPLYSHCLEISSVGQGLVENGHEVSIYFASNFEHKHCYKRSNAGDEIKPIIFQAKPGAESISDMSLRLQRILMEKDFSMIFDFDLTTQFLRNLCTSVLFDKDKILAMKGENFDLAIVDGFFLSHCTYIIPYVLDLPFVSISTVYDDFISGRPPLYSISPHFASTFTGHMTFWQKLANLLQHLSMHALSRYTIPMEVVQDTAPELDTQDVLTLASRAELYLYNMDTVLSYPVPAMSNHVYVGGIATQPANPLKGEFQKIYNSSTAVVLVTFGSTVSLLSEKAKRVLVSALKKLNVNVVWRYSETGVDQNIYKFNWVPQNDLLGDPKTKLFVSHCGNNGLYEAVYHGVPIICTPMFGDQFFNAERVQYWNVGLHVDIRKSTEEEVFTKLAEALNNPLYAENMRKASSMFHGQPLKPRDRAVFWIEHVIKFGGKHLRSKGLDMNPFSFIGYDLVLFVIGIAVLFLFVVYKMCICCWRCA